MDYPITVAQARELGITRRRLRSRRWRRVGPAQYAPASLPDAPELRLRAALARLPADAVFSDRTAGWLHGLDLAPCKPIQAIVAPGSVSIRTGMTVRRVPLAAEDIATVKGLPVTSPLRTVRDLASRLPLVEAVIATDQALGRGLVSRDQLSAAAAAAAGRQGVIQLRRVVELADGNAESPMETRLRLVLVFAGLPRPASQVPLHDDDGRFLGRPDFYYPEHRICIEFDGAVHRDQLVEDSRRQNRLVGAGFLLLRYTGPDVQVQPDRIVREVRGALLERSPSWAIRKRMAGRGALQRGPQLTNGRGERTVA